MKISINELKKIIKSEIKNKLYEQTEYEQTELEKKFYNRLNTLITNIKDELEQGNLPSFALYIDSYPNKRNPTDIYLIAINPNKIRSALFEHALKRIEKLRNNQYIQNPIIIKNQNVGKGGAVKEMREYIIESKNLKPYPENIFIPHERINILDGYLGYIHLNKSNESCFGAWHTYYTRAVGGNGPLMYSIAASYVKKEFGSGLKKYNKITSDKRSVSSDAQGVWEKTYTQRNDYKKYKLDNYEKPETPDTWDDCHLYNKNDYLNYAYEIETPLNYENFISAFDLFLNSLVIDISEILNESGYNSNKVKLKSEIKSHLVRQGETFYDLR